jgi:hypothetical protein
VSGRGAGLSSCVANHRASPAGGYRGLGQGLDSPALTLGADFAGNWPDRGLCFGVPSGFATLPQQKVSQRRSVGGPRREASERVVLKAPGREFDGWTLNVSRGGLRIILEGAVSVGDEFAALVGPSEEGSPRPARVVWVRNESDGQIVGLKYLDSSEGPPAPSDSPAGAP